MGTNKGFVYIFTNPSFRNLIKIGLSDNFERRLKDLSSSTAIPFPFECFCVEVADRGLEISLLEQLRDGQVKKRRMFN